MEQKDGIVPDALKKLVELKGKISEAKKTAEYVRLGVQAVRTQKAQQLVENETKAAPAEADSGRAPSVEELARIALEKGIMIRDGKTDDTDGEDPK